MSKLNRTAKRAFYNARSRKNDTNTIAYNTGYSVSHVCNVIAGRRSVPQDIADEMYRISRRRTKNSEMVNA